MSASDWKFILAAGALLSLQILQLSGIGPRELLSGLGIDMLVDLPGVGRNYHDQPTLFMEYSCRDRRSIRGSWRFCGEVLHCATVENYPYPSPSWLMTNESWADAQLVRYHEDSTGKPITRIRSHAALTSHVPFKTR